MYRFLLICLLVCSRGLPTLGQSLPGSRGNPFVFDLFIRQQNGVYGIGDSANFWLSNSPKGDTAFHVGDSRFAIRGADGLYSLIDELFKVEKAQLSELKTFGRFIFLKERKGWTIFSEDEDSNPIYYDSIRIAGSSALLYKNGKQGLLYLTGVGEFMIPAQYDKAGPYYEGVLLIDHGKLGWKGAFDIPVAYDHIYQERPDIMAAQNKDGTVYYSYDTGKPLEAEPGDSIVFYDRCYKRVRGRMQSIFRISDNSLVAEIEGEQIHPYSFERSYRQSEYCVIGRDTACALYRNGRQLTEFSYRNILPESSIAPPFFRVLQKGGVGVILENGEVQLSSQYTDVLNRIGNYYIVRRGSGLGLVSVGDTVLLPCEYRNITFCNGTYLYLSKDGTYFALYNYITRKVISPYKYRNFWIDRSFIIAKQTTTGDIYYNDEAMMTDLYDAEVNGQTAKGYKNGKVYIGSVGKTGWESYEYEIPSYKVKAGKDYPHYLQSAWLQDIGNVYDYASGKWGVFSYSSGKWKHAPLAHGGDDPHACRLLDFPADSNLSWQGLNFHLRKKISPIAVAWDRKSKYSWIDTHDYTYTSDDTERSSVAVSPLCYTEPGMGRCLSNFMPAVVNTGFPGYTNKTVLAEGGRVKVGHYGQIGLSAFITQMSSSGNIHPAGLQDYETLIDPRLFVSISGATEHVLQVSNCVKHISAQSGFEWVDPEHPNPMICRVAGKYGLLSDTGSYLLKPEYESIDPIGGRGSAVYRVGVRGSSYRLYYPESDTYSKEIAQLLSFKGPCLLIKADSTRLAVLDHRLDTLLISSGAITLLEDSGYVLKKEGISYVYKNRRLLFSHNGGATEKINEGHYLVSNSSGHYILSPKGDTIYQSKQAIRYVPLGNNYLLDSGQDRTVFDLSDKAVCRFGKEPYLVTDKKHLIVKEKESVVLLEKNGTKPVRLKGRYARATGLYVITRNAKNKQVYDYPGNLLVNKALKVKAINDRYFSYQLGKKFRLYDVLTGEKRPIERLGVSISKEGLEYDGSDEEDDSTQVVESIEELYSIVGYRGKYGLKKAEKLILPYGFFHIQKADDVFLVQDKIEYRLYDLFSNTFITNDSYESVYPCKVWFQVWRNGKMSYIKR